MYESPIEVYHKDMQTKIENHIFEAVCNVGVFVDKDELIKALKYDRDQYRKGYEDGFNGANDKIVRCKDCMHSYFVKSCRGKRKLKSS